MAKNDQPEHPDEPQRLSLPVYGNYCGFGHGDPTFKTPPIDAVDVVCREHDRCYGLLGDFDERCDRNLIEMMPNAIALTPTPLGKQVGLLTMLYFSLAERNLGLGELLLKRGRGQSRAGKSRGRSRSRAEEEDEAGRGQAGGERRNRQRLKNKDPLGGITDAAEHVCGITDKPTGR